MPNCAIYPGFTITYAKNNISLENSSEAEYCVLHVRKNKLRPHPDQIL